MRKAAGKRETRETRIEMEINIDGSGKGEIDCPLGFFTHMLETFALHGGFDLKAKLEGDLHVDAHHLVEDTGIVLGKAMDEALGDRKGIKRAGFFYFPMDEALARAVIDISGRPCCYLDADFPAAMIGDFPAELTGEFFAGLSRSLQATLHLQILYGKNTHHMVEALFKAAARAFREGVLLNDDDVLPSSKGVL